MEGGKAAMTRLMSDLREMQTDPPPGCSAAPIAEDNLFVWTASIIGPEDSEWEGGIYSIRMQFSEAYPGRPPKVRFTCRMYHPNIYPDGNVCLDTIQTSWSPIYTISTLLTSIRSLLTDPNVSSPANPDAARMLSESPKDYRRKIRKIAEESLS